MGAHAPQPSEQQIKPLAEEHHAMWSAFTKATTYGVIGVIAVLALMAIFLIKH